jgi:CreA protein
MRINSIFISIISIISIFFGVAHATEEIGSVDTTLKLVGANNKIVIEVFDDPMVSGVSCYVSRAKTGGIRGSLGLAEDTSDASVACRQVGPIEFKGNLPKQDEVFRENISFLFKKLRVVRVVDVKRQTLVYLVYSNKIIDGSPKNSITAVPIGRPIPLK